MSIRHYFLVILIMVLFGSAFVLGKLVLNTNVPPLLFGSLRMLVVFLCLIPFFKFQKIEKKNIKPLIIFSLSMGVGVTGFTYLSLEESNIVSPVIIGSQLAIPFAIILSTIFLNESINLKKWFFVVSSFVGIILIGFDPELINNIFALILTGGMSFFYAIANVSGRNLNKINVVTTNTLMASTGFIILLTLSILIEGDTIKIINSIDINIWILIIYSGLIVSVGAHMSLFYLYKFYPVGKVLPFYSLFPVFGLVQTFIVFREIPSLLVTLGGIIVVGSVFIIQKIK